MVDEAALVDARFRPVDSTGLGPGSCSGGRRGLAFRRQPSTVPGFRVRVLSGRRHLDAVSYVLGQMGVPLPELRARETADDLLRLIRRALGDGGA